MGAENIFFSTLRIFDLELNQPRIAGLRSECSPTVLAGPGLVLNLSGRAFLSQLSGFGSSIFLSFYKIKKVNIE